MTKEYKNYLAHHGIKGQKWGIRRFQNEDGSVTAAGTKRYLIGNKDQKYRTGVKTDGYQQQKNRISTEYKTSDAVTAKRKQETKKIIGAVAGVALTAALAYGAYKGGKAVVQWQHDNMDVVRGWNKQLTNLKADRWEGMGTGRWTKSQERSYRSTSKEINRYIRRAYLGKR